MHQGHHLLAKVASRVMIVMILLLLVIFQATY